MSTSLLLNNFPRINIKEETQLDNDYDAASTSLKLVNNQNIAAGDYLYIGVKGSETGEILTVQSVSGATIATTSPTTLKHNRFDPVFSLNGNQFQVYRAPNVNGLQPSDDAFTAYGSPFNIDPDQLQTSYTDSSGSGDYWYKVTYLNSTTLAASPLAASKSVRGGNIGNYCSLELIRNEAGFENNRNISDSLVDTFRQQAQSEVNGSLSGKYVVPFVSPINPTIERITMLLGAGYLQIDQYGQTYNSDTSGTNNKVAEGLRELNKLRSGESTVVGATGVDAALPDASGGGGYPNRDTNDIIGDDSEDFMFKRDYISGYNGRHY
jgi:hypothetical protein